MIVVNWDSVIHLQDRQWYSPRICEARRGEFNSRRGTDERFSEPIDAILFDCNLPSDEQAGTNMMLAGHSYGLLGQGAAAEWGSSPTVDMAPRELS